MRPCTLVVVLVPLLLAVAMVTRRGVLGGVAGEALVLRLRHREAIAGGVRRGWRQRGGDGGRGRLSEWVVYVD